MLAKSRALASVAAIGLAAAGVAVAVDASAKTNPVDDTKIQIVGGEKVRSDWVVQLSFQQGSGTYGCSGSAISADWILTAKHCIDGTTSMNVYFSNSTTNRGPAVKAGQMVAAPSGDVALVKLSQSHPLQTYGTLSNTAYTPKAGDKGQIAGYGLRAARGRADNLYAAWVDVIGASRDAFGGPAVHMRGNTGASNHGDSGGPFWINKGIAGVCSTGDSADPGSDTKAGSNYALIGGVRDWIKSTAGV